MHTLKTYKKSTFIQLDLKHLNTVHRAHRAVHCVVQSTASCGLPALRAVHCIVQSTVSSSPVHHVIQSTASCSAVHRVVQSPRRAVYSQPHRAVQSTASCSPPCRATNKIHSFVTDVAEKYSKNATCFCL